MNVIKTEGLTKAFLGVLAVKQLSFCVQEKQIFGLVGPDGSGKTTTMRMLAGILPPTAGSCEILGYSLLSQAELIKGSIGYMSQRFGLYQDLTVLENIDFYADIYDVHGEEKNRRQQELLEFSGLNPFKHRFAGNLSGGMKQKLGLICALIHSPRLVLLDEPTNGVDPVSRRDFWNILKQLQAQGVSILMTTSYLDEAEKCDRIALLNEGQLILEGTLEEIRAKQKGILIEVVLADSRRNIQLFESQWKSAALHGNKIHLPLENEGEMAQVVDFCKTHELRIESIHPIIPSLEDIFISEIQNR